MTITKKVVTRYYVNFRQNGIKHHSHHAKLETAQKHQAMAVLRSLTPWGVIPHETGDGDFGVFCMDMEIEGYHKAYIRYIIEKLKSGAGPYTITMNELEKNVAPFSDAIEEIYCGCYDHLKKEKNNERTNE